MFNWQQDVGPEQRRGRIESYDAWRDVCRRWRETRVERRERPGGSRGTRTQSFRWIWSPREARAGVSIVPAPGAEPTPRSLRPTTPPSSEGDSPEEARPLLNCEDMTNADLLAAMDMPGRNGEGSLRDYNMAIAVMLGRY